MRNEPLNIMPDLLGYAHPAYALSFREFGEPRELPGCGGWIIVRPIPGTPYKDAIGSYPLFACRDWTKLREDLEHVGSDIVSLVLVTDPFSGVAPGYLEKYFHMVKPFKTHYLVDHSHSLKSFVGRVHRKNARKSLEKMDVEVCSQPARYLDEWIRLYDNLIRRHNIKGINAFSPQCFKNQLNIPGMVMFLGRRGGEIIGATLVLIRDQVAYIHLSAFTQEGYKISASYGIHWKALEYICAQGIRYTSFGGVAGLREDPSDGMAQYKRGWSNHQRMVYLCGRIINRQKYESMCQQYQIANADYFPAYRAGDCSKAMTGERKLVHKDMPAF